MKPPYNGSCLCSQIKFKVTGFSKEAAACHCTMCRKFHGAAFGTLVEVSGLQWLSGESQLKEYVGSNGTVRSFCNACGSSLAFRCKDSPATELEIAVACFDEDIPIAIDAHIFTRYKACWIEPDKNLPNHSEGRPK